VVACAPSSSVAQTLNLGNAGADGFFAVYNANLYNETGGVLGTGSFNFSNSTDLGGGTLGAYTSVGGFNSTVVGSLAYDPSASIGSGVNILGTTNSSAAIGTYIAGLGQTAINTATTAQGWSTSGASAPNATVNGSNYQFTGSSGNNVITIKGTTNSGLLSLSNSTITLTGTSSEQFVFNITAAPHTGVTWSNVTVVLNGVSVSNVFYNFISGGNGIGINSSNLTGTVLNVITGSSMSIDNSIVNGAVVSDGFVDVANSVIAPELPTIMMAGVVCLILLGKVSLDCRRSLAARSASPRS